MGGYYSAGKQRRLGAAHYRRPEQQKPSLRLLRRLQCIRNADVVAHLVFHRPGATWSDISQSLPNVPVHSLVIDPNSSSTEYVGTETGVYETTNNGTTWSSFNSGMPWYVPTDELVVQNTTSALFAFTHGRGVFSTAPSTNVSPGWTVQSSGINTNLASVKAVSQSIAWAAGNEAQVLTTTNGGTTWKPVGGGVIVTQIFMSLMLWTQIPLLSRRHRATQRSYIEQQTPVQHGRMSTALRVGLSTGLK